MILSPLLVPRVNASRFNIIGTFEQNVSYNQRDTPPKIERQQKIEGYSHLV